MGLLTNKADVSDIQQSVKASFLKVKDELNEHLEALNENTNEIQANYEYMMELESRIDKLNEKMEQIILLLDGRKEKEQLTVQPLTLREQEVAACLYTLDESASSTYHEISRRVGLPTEMIKQLVQSLIAKGVPIIKRFMNNELMLELDSEFRVLQAKTNLLQINEQVLKQVTY